MSSPPGVRADPCYRFLERETSFRGRVVGVSVDRFVLPGGRETTQEVIHLPSAVCVVPLLIEKGREVEAVLVEQFRGSVRGFIHEFPAGIIEAGEEPPAAAARELEEETGYRAERLTHLVTVFPLPGSSSHRMHFFMAEGLMPGTQRLEDGEILSVIRVPFRSLLESVVRSAAASPAPGGIIVVDAKTHLGTLHVAARKGIVPPVQPGDEKEPQVTQRWLPPANPT